MIRIFGRHIIPVIAIASFAICYYSFKLYEADFDVARSSAQVLIQQDDWKVDELDDALQGFVLERDENIYEDREHWYYRLEPRGEFRISVDIDSNSRLVSKVAMDYRASDEMIIPAVAEAPDQEMNMRLVRLTLITIVMWYLFLYLPDRGLSKYLRWIPFAISVCAGAMLSFMGSMTLLIDF